MHQNPPVQIDGKWGHIDRTGRVAIQPVYDSASGFYDGQATVGTGDKYWFIDKSGKKVGECPPQSCKFREGLAPVEIKSKWGYIDKTGRVVIEPKFSEAYDFSGGIAMVILPGGKMGYIDKTGKYVWRPTK
ncbi:MAG: WG repeat-containing protein [Acidobacteria bacterium]|nr:WG repeat-containing protein [Acidobacteriota bacterium]